MKNTLALLTGLLLLAAGSLNGDAANLHGELWKIINYEQSSNAGPTIVTGNPYAFQAWGREGAAGAAPAGNLSLTVDLPVAAGYPTSPLPMGPRSFPRDTQFLNTYASAAALNLDFPNDIYDLTIENPVIPEGPYSATVAFPLLDEYPSLVPEVLNATWNGAGQLVVSPQFTLSFNDPDGDASINRYWLEITKVPGEPALPGWDAGRWTVVGANLPDSRLAPGGTNQFQVNTLYNATLSFYNTVDSTVLGDGGDRIRGGFVTATSFQILTTPEPSRALLTLLGLGVVLGRRRRCGSSRQLRHGLNR